MVTLVPMGLEYQPEISHPSYRQELPAVAAMAAPERKVHSMEQFGDLGHHGGVGLAGAVQIHLDQSMTAIGTLAFIWSRSK